MTKSPAFLLYVDKFLLGSSRFTTEEVGIYILLLCEQWDKGFIPSDEKELEKITRSSYSTVCNVLVKFKKKRGKLINERLELERAKNIEYRKRQATNGLHGGRPKSGGLATGKPDDASGETQKKPTRKHNKISIRIKKEKVKKEKTPANLESVENFFQEIQSTKQEANKFWYHFESNGWLVGKSKAPMQDWKASARGWVGRSPEFKSPKVNFKEVNLTGQTAN